MTATPIDPRTLAQISERCEAVMSEVQAVYVGPRAIPEILLVTLLARGHVLLEGVPGVAKTTLCKAFAATLGCHFRRIQFTPDLLPADITGTYVFTPSNGQFQLREGPVFTNVLLGDEINRAPAKTQSALLEVMQEYQVTLDGQTLPLPRPFMVIATQNPIETEGTYPLPEAQLDRFLLKIRIGYPSAAEEAALTRHVTDRSTGADLSVDAVRTLVQPATVLALQQAAAYVAVDDRVMDYAIAVVRATRESPNIACGAGPRGSIALVRVARAMALMAGRAFATPDDVKDAALPALRHRIAPSAEAEIEGLTADELLSALLEQVAAPRS